MKALIRHVRILEYSSFDHAQLQARVIHPLKMIYITYITPTRPVFNLQSPPTRALRTLVVGDCKLDTSKNVKKKFDKLLLVAHFLIHGHNYNILYFIYRGMWGGPRSMRKSLHLGFS